MNSDADDRYRFTTQETGQFLAAMALQYPQRSIAEENEFSVSHYFKPQTKYPPRLYLLYGHWPGRNRRAAGIAKQPCLFSRQAGPFERDEMRVCGRLMSRQYEAHEMNRLLWRMIEDECTDALIDAMLSDVLPHCTPEFRNHWPVAQIREVWDRGGYYSEIERTQQKLPI